jgi:phosphoribosylaminoimidazole carboxylase PurE protein
MKVAILMGSPNDKDKMQPAADTLERFGIEPDVRVLSAHRNPAQVTELAASAREQGYVAFICGAGMAAHLAGVVAAHTTLPVVGVPLASGALNGVDALYSTVQMPKGIPVATVAVSRSATRRWRRGSPSTARRSRARAETRAGPPARAQRFVASSQISSPERHASTSSSNAVARTAVASSGSTWSARSRPLRFASRRWARSSRLTSRGGRGENPAVLRTPAALMAHATQNGGFLGPNANTRQGSQNHRPQRRQMPTASSNPCFSHVCAIAKALWVPPSVCRPDRRSPPVVAALV